MYELYLNRLDCRVIDYVVDYDVDYDVDYVVEFVVDCVSDRSLDSLDSLGALLGGHGRIDSAVIVIVGIVSLVFISLLSRVV